MGYPEEELVSGVQEELNQPAKEACHKSSFSRSSTSLTLLPLASGARAEVGQRVPDVLAELLDNGQVVASHVVHQEGQVASQLEHCGLRRVPRGDDVRHIGVGQLRHRVPVAGVEEEDDAGLLLDAFPVDEVLCCLL